MPEHLRALAYVLLIGLIVFWLARPLREQQLPTSQGLRRGLWIAFTAAAFLTGNFWIFCAVALALLIWVRTQDGNVPALFLGLLFVLPPAQQDIPGFGMVNFLFSLNLPRLLTLVLLAPLALRLVQQPRRRLGAGRAADLLFIGYLFVQLVLLVREPSVTSALRSVFYLFTDIVLPYYVFSRAFDGVRRIRDAVAAFVTAAAVLAAIGVFEFARHWLLYSALTDVWGSADKLLYLGRQGVLRAMGTTGHAIALGYVMAVALLLYLGLRARMRPGWRRAAMLLLLAGGLFAPLSRGPWIGAAAGLAVYLLLSARPVRNLLVAAGSGAAALAVLAVVPGGHFVLGMVPFIGKVEAGNIEYRQRLVDKSMELIWQHPLLGSSDYVEQLARMGMMQGQGIVDIVNTYVQVALRSGLLGLGLFAGFMAAALLSTLRARSVARRSHGDGDGADELGRGLVAAQVAVVVTIATVSSIVVIPWVYWCLAGLLVGYARVVNATVRQPSTMVQGALRPA